MPPTPLTRVQLWLGSYVGWVAVDLNLTPRVFLRVLRFSSLLKIDCRPIPSGCVAVLRGHTWVVFRGRAPSWQHSSFGPTSLSCALSNSVSDCEKGRLAGQILCYYFECKFWISRSAITHVQNWPIGPQRVGSVEKWCHLLTSLNFSVCKRSLLYMQIKSLKVWKGQFAAITTALGIGSENNGHKERYKRNNGP